MQICPTKTSIRDFVKQTRQRGVSVALVPTMGFLHDGHMALVKRASELADVVIVTIFVNPTQFGPNEDLDKYPRDMERDLALLQAAGVSAVFTPTPDEMYHPEAGTTVDVPALSGILQGAIRPGHFQGVATVVTKLFNIIAADVAVFGEKDFQQLTLIRQMVRDLDQPVQIVGHPTMREKDGLAMSSRNVRLTDADRAAAPALNRALDAAEAIDQDGPTIDHLVALVTQEIEDAKRGEIESAEIRDARTLEPMTGKLTSPAVILLAVRFGSVLLIDQRVIGPGKETL